MKPADYQIPVSEMAKAVSEMDVSNPLVYGNYLAQTYYYVAHSTRLLALSAGLMGKNDEEHFRRFVKHIAEENAHDVMAEADLHDLGFTIEDFPELPFTRTFWESQYYKVEHEGPFALMGYILALEYFACTNLPPLLEKVEKLYGGKARRFIKVHAEEDPDHTEKAIKVIEALTPEQQAVVMVNLKQSAAVYAALTRACSDVSHLKLTDYRSEQSAPVNV
ncbi:MAG: iron-containing redox enzyme family protein [Bdellovibrionales bacterium]|nr:iron-containing redox enzyme family protein [Bdellovibrionales bacterium]